MMGHDFMPYQARRGDVITENAISFGKSTQLVEMPISWSLDDFPHFEYFRGGGLMHAGQVLDNWLGDLTYMQTATDWGVLTYTFHPFVIGRGHRMLMLEKFLNHVEGHDVRFATIEEVAREHRRLHPLGG